MYKRSIPKLKVIKNDNIKNFLWENGVFPVKEYYEKSYYEVNPLFLSLLDTYFIKYTCIPNKM